MSNRVDMDLAVKRVRESKVYLEAAAFMKADERHTIDQQLELVQIPSYSNHEELRAKRFQELMQAEGYEAYMDEVCNVYTVIPGSGDGPTVYISAHLDTVFPMDTKLEPRFEGTKIFCPGIADDTRGCAEILSLLRAIRHVVIKPVGNLIIGANVGEEGLGDLRGMRHFFQKDGKKVDAFFTLDGVDSGNRVSVTYGATGSIRYKVTFHGPGGHSYGDYGCVNPIHAMGRAIYYISELRTPELPKTTFSVGVVDGGTSVNSIAHTCSMLIDMRSDEQEPLEQLNKQVLSCINRAVEEENEHWTEERKWSKNMFGRTYDVNARIRVDIEQVGNRPGGSQSLDDPIVRLVYAVHHSFGVECVPIAHSSTDANIAISMKIPACGLPGGGKTANNHSLDEWFDTTDSYIGPQRALLAILTCAGITGVCEPALEKICR